VSAVGHGVFVVVGVSVAGIAFPFNRGEGLGQTGARVFTLARGVLGCDNCVRRIFVGVCVVSGAPLNKLDAFGAEVSADSVHVVARCT